MENASKALIIAGAILLSILIIGIAMFIFNSANETLEKTVSRMSEQEQSTHNQRFQKFAGDRRSGTDVKSLVSEMTQNYTTQLNNGELGRVPGVNYSAGTTTITIDQKAGDVDQQFNDMMGNIKATRSYKVDVLVDPAAGIVNQINITENAK